MPKKKHQMTPFARLLLVLIIAAPASYIGASYYNGEDGIENIKKLFGAGSTETTETRAVSNDKNLEKENRFLLEQNRELKQENKALKKELKELKATSE